MRFRDNLKQNEQGMVAIITVLLLVVVLSILTLGFLRLSVNEERQSTDDDLSARAYYAAEAGITDARVMLKNAADEYIEAVKDGDYDGNFQGFIDTNYAASVCDKPDRVVSPENELDMEYTCLRLSTDPAYEANLDEGEVQVVILPGQANGAELAWHKMPEYGTGAPENDGYFEVSSGGQKQLQRREQWNDNQRPALLRATFFYKDGADFAQKTAFFYPKEHSVATPIDFTGAFDGQLYGDAIQCYNFDDLWTAGWYGKFACRADVVNLPEDSELVAVALSTRYRSATIKVTATRWEDPLDDSTRTEVGIDQGQVIADVTGRSGDVFRRVEARLDLSAVFFKGALDIDDESIDGMIDPDDTDYTIISGNSICKAFSVDDSAASKFDSWCNYNNY